jgi:hypothetical protein
MECEMRLLPGLPENMQNFASGEAKFCHPFGASSRKRASRSRGSGVALKPVRVLCVVCGLKSRAGILPAHLNGLRRLFPPCPDRLEALFYIISVNQRSLVVKNLCGSLRSQRLCVEGVSVCLRPRCVFALIIVAAEAQ